MHYLFFSYEFLITSKIPYKSNNFSESQYTYIKIHITKDK
jgi:hypothetical protein